MKLINTIKASFVGCLVFAAASQTNVLHAEWDTAYWSDSYVDSQAAYEDYQANAHFAWAYEYYYLGEVFPYYHYFSAGWHMDYQTRAGRRGYIAYNQWAWDKYIYHADLADYYWLTYH